MNSVFDNITELINKEPEIFNKIYELDIPFKFLN